MHVTGMHSLLGCCFELIMSDNARCGCWEPTKPFENRGECGDRGGPKCGEAARPRRRDHNDITEAGNLPMSRSRGIMYEGVVELFPISKRRSRNKSTRLWPPCWRLHDEWGAGQIPYPHYCKDNTERERLQMCSVGVDTGVTVEIYSRNQST